MKTQMLIPAGRGKKDTKEIDTCSVHCSQIWRQGSLLWVEKVFPKSNKLLSKELNVVQMSVTLHYWSVIGFTLCERYVVPFFHSKSSWRRCPSAMLFYPTRTQAMEMATGTNIFFSVFGIVVKMSVPSPSRAVLKLRFMRGNLFAFCTLEKGFFCEWLPNPIWQSKLNGYQLLMKTDL